ncbi:ABC transporter substrate-binding protein [Paenibacillus sp. 79R4]|uniref:ABC transporter substrate-binding protein n=1 Tax=Paenibacillus sp. 79R4 TaxID=2212847 RepID=UPI002118250F|nr:ABC transporter substrate-binding protein [Paenibacillus sp. 79R4]
MKVQRMARISTFGLLIFMLLLVAGCGRSDKGQAGTVPSERAAVTGGNSSQSPTRTVQDAKGEVTIPAEPRRIADISGSTEELLVLGFQPILTGNTDMGNPAEATPLLKEKLDPNTLIGGWFQTEVDVEAVMAAEPDLILAGPTQEKIYDQLSRIAPTVRVPYGFNAFRDRFAFVSAVLDKHEVMEQWMAEYEAQAVKDRERIQAKTGTENFAIIEATQKEIRIYSRTGIADMIYNDLRLPPAPGLPEPDAWGGKVTSLEGLSTLNPDHLILMADSSDNVLEKSSIWNSLKAVQAGKVYRMTSRQNYNEAFFALGKKSLMNQLVEDILKGSQ